MKPIRYSLHRSPTGRLFLAGRTGAPAASSPPAPPEKPGERQAPPVKEAAL